MNLSGPISAHHWFYSPDHGQLCNVIETQTLRGDTTCRVWLPGSDSVVRIPADNLQPLKDTATGTSAQITYAAAAARAADALTQDLSACDTQAGGLRYFGPLDMPFGHGGISVEELIVPLIQIERLPVRCTQTERKI